MYQPVSTDPMLGNIKGVYGTEKDSVVRSNMQPMRLEETTSTKYNDKGFAIVFLLQCVLLVTLALTAGVKAIHTLIPDVDTKGEEYNKVFSLLMGMASMALILAMLWMRLLLFYAHHMIRVGLWMNVGFCIAMGIATLSVNFWLPLVFLASAAINVCYIYMVRNRIAFASANLKCACDAISANKSIIGVAFVLVLVQFVYMMVWLMATVGVYQSFRAGDPRCQEEEQRGQLCGGSGVGVAAFFLLLALFWGQQVVQNILTCTTAGVVATWWYRERSEGSVTGSLYRSMTTSFGSICFGSLLVAILQTLETLARFLREKANNENNSAMACVACLAECILSCLRGIMEYMNKWAFCYVGIYGYDFITSGKAVMALFTNRGWTAVINDDLASTALGLSALCIGLISAGVGVIVAKLAPGAWLLPLTTDAAKYGTFGLFAFIAGLSMACVLIAVITTALHTVFVCFAEDPLAFNRTHPEEYTHLVAAWKEFQPNAWSVAYGEYI